MKYIYNGKSTRRDCTCVVKRNYRRCKEFTLKNMSTIREEPCWFSNVNSIIIIIITYKKRWRWTWYPGPFKCSAKVPRKIRDSRGVKTLITCVVGLVLPGQIWGPIMSHLLLAVFHVITFSRSYFAYFLWKNAFLIKMRRRVDNRNLTYINIYFWNLNLDFRIIWLARESAWVNDWL